MSEKIQITYDGVEITYVESTNKWNFELRGRERNVDSLQTAKEAIDKPEPVKKKPFTRVPAFILENLYSSTAKFVPVEVTSIAERQPYSSTPYVWIVGADGHRKRQNVYYVYADTAENRMRIAKYTADAKIVEGLEKDLAKTLKGVATIEVPNE